MSLEAFDLSPPIFSWCCHNCVRWYERSSCLCEVFGSDVEYIPDCIDFITDHFLKSKHDQPCVISLSLHQITSFLCSCKCFYFKEWVIWLLLSLLLLQGMKQRVLILFSIQWLLFFPRKVGTTDFFHRQWIFSIVLNLWLTHGRNTCRVIISLNREIFWRKRWIYVCRGNHF